MKIAIYHNLLSGGAKRALNEYAQRLCKNHQLDIFNLTSSNHDFADIRPYANQYHEYPFTRGNLFNSPFGRLNQVVRMLDLVRIEKVNRQIAQDIDAGGYDLAFIHPCQVENCPSVVYFLKKTPSVYYCPESLRTLYEVMPARPYDGRESSGRQVLNRVDPLPGLFHRAQKQRDARNLRAADRILVNSEFTRQSVNKIYQVEAKVSRLGVDDRLFRKIVYEKQPFVLSVGSLTPLKGFDFVIRALAQLPPERRLPLRIVSNFQNPPERDYLTGLANSLDVDLTLLDGISDEMLVRLYNQATLVLYAPIREPFGFVAIEAMACGTPVVAVREGGVCETVIDSKVGLLTDRREEDFAQAILTLLDHPDRLQEYGQNARTYVKEQWTWDRAVEILENHLQETLKANNPTPPASH